MAAITGLDHVILAVAALDAARDTWRRLGFTVTPRGRHIGWGTANYCIMLQADYIELLGVLDPAQFDNGLSERLARDGEGLLGISLATRSADSAASAFGAAGAGGEPARDLARLLDLPDGPVQPAFRLAYPARRDAFGLPLFACEHRSPELLRRPDWECHANGATGILRLDLPAPLAEPALAAWAALDGARREGDLGRDRWLHPQHWRRAAAAHRDKRPRCLRIGAAGRPCRPCPASGRDQGAALAGNRLGAALRVNRRPG